MEILSSSRDKPIGSPPSVCERRISLSVLVVLAIIAAAVVAVQSRFDPASWQDQPSSDENKAQSDPALSIDVTVAGLKPLTPPEQYDPATLSDKINGKAELYLSAGFERLETQRFALDSDTGRWMERYVYHMGRFENAYAVFSSQRRPNAQPLALSSDAYQAANGLFFVQGPFYVEIIAGDLSEALQAKMISLAQAFVEGHPVARASLDERDLFPPTHRVADSTALAAANAFGFERLDRVYTALYQHEGLEAIAFLSRRASGQEAKDLAEAFGAFLVEYGGKRVEPASGTEELQIVDVYDTFDIIFSHGPYLAGIHEAGSLEFGLLLADELRGQVRRSLETP